MDGHQNDHEGMLILRAWVERESGLRVRITRTLDGRELPVVMAADVEDACTAVREWLNNLLD